MDHGKVAEMPVGSPTCGLGVAAKPSLGIQTLGVCLSPHLDVKLPSSHRVIVSLSALLI